MSIPWCPNCEHVTAEEPWTCETCGEHGCHLCEEIAYFDGDGGHRCESCEEKARRRISDGPAA